MARNFLSFLIGSAAVAGLVLFAGVSPPNFGEARPSGGEPQKQNAEPAWLEELKLFSKALGVIQDAYVGDAKPRNLLYDAVKGMLGSLDKYCEFIDPGRYGLFQIYLKGEYAGVGILLQTLDNYPAVRAVQPGSPAEKAGLMPQDKILKVNGISMENKPLPDAAALLRGEKDTRVLLTLWRAREGKTLEVELQRETVAIESVKDSRMLTKTVGYFRIAHFEENTVGQVDKALDALAKRKMKALIIDLRNNDGGLMPQAVELAERFLAEGKKIVSVKSKIKEQAKEYVCTGKKTRPDWRLVVLVNRQSASASEIFSAAMQEHGRAAIVGTRTYGKGSVQSVVPLDDQSAMKLTTARYLTPSGRMIDGVGIEPDEKIPEESPEGGSIDPYLLAALEVLKDH